MSAADAKAYAALGDNICTLSRESADIAPLRREFDVFKSIGAVAGTRSETAFVSGPYQASKTMR